jgi:hypothetical protein
MPTRKLDDGVWPHPSRLPLGCGWEGHCTAPGHEGAVPAASRLHEECSLGYASNCPHMPVERAWDAIRFAVSREHDSRIWVAYVCERNHLPAEHGNLEYRVHDGQWTNCHPDGRVQKMAECFLESWLQRVRPAPSNDPQPERIYEQN